MWVHWTKCSEQPGKRAKVVPGFRCSRCHGTARSIHVQTDERIYANGEPLESVDTFCYLGILSVLEVAANQQQSPELGLHGVSTEIYNPSLVAKMLH